MPDTTPAGKVYRVLIHTVSGDAVQAVEQAFSATNGPRETWGPHELISQTTTDYALSDDNVRNLAWAAAGAVRTGEVDVLRSVLVAIGLMREETSDACHRA